MKKLLNILLAIVFTAICAMGLFACGDNDGDEKTGLLYKMYPGDDYYTVYGYVDEGDDLKVLDIASYVKEKEGDDVKIGRIKADAFKDNDTLTSIIVPDTVEVIDGGAFAGMKALTSLTLPFVGNTLNADASFNQTKPAEDKAIDAERTFGYIFGTDEYEGGVKMTQLYAEGETEQTADYYMPLTFKSVTIKASGEYSIPMYAFAGNQFVEEVELIGGVKTIGQSAFKNCFGLKEINIPVGVETIRENAFSGCANLAKVDFAEDSVLEAICDKAFSGCVKLEEIFFKGAENVALLNGAFSGCVGLKNVKIDNLKFISAWAFYGCENLNYVGAGTIANKTIDFTNVHVEDFAFAESIDVSTYSILGSYTSNVFYKAPVA